MSEFVTELLRAVVLAAVPVCATFLCKGIAALAKYLTERTDDALMQKYLAEVSDAVQTAVAMLNQTYVDSLKQAGKFDEDAQRRALAKAYTKAEEMLTAEAREFLTRAYGDLDSYIISKVEAEVRNQKMYAPGKLNMV